MKSVWENKTDRPHFDTLTKDVKTDVLVIGGGIAGILCAHVLKSSGVDCVLVEANEICSGITKNTTAKITCQHGLIYSKLIKTYGTEFAQGYFNAQSDAVDSYRELCKKIPCDFTQSDSYVYLKDNRREIEEEIKALEKIGYTAKFTKDLALPFSIAGAVGIENQAHFHPLKLLYSIAKELIIYENTKVTQITPHGAITPYGKIKAKKIIVATHFPFLNRHGSYFLKMYQHRSYVIAYENIPNPVGMLVDGDMKGMSFRSYKDTVLIGGGGHRTGKNGGNWDEISSFVKNNYPNAKELCHFATQDCITVDSVPYIGQYSKNTPSLYVATGFNKWGMTSAMVAAKLLCDMVLGEKNDYERIFSPQRSIWHPQLAINIAESTIGLLTPKAPRCPHMGCALKYNRCEHSWDCACHGSRFTHDGELIDNPANKNLK